MRKQGSVKKPKERWLGFNLGEKLYLRKRKASWYLEDNRFGSQKRISLKTKSMREAAMKALGLIRYCVTCGRKLDGNGGK